MLDVLCQLYPNKEDFRYIYHNTDEETKNKIIDSGSIHSGTSFCCTLINGDLPNYSPYGDERVVIDIENLWSSFEEPTLYRYRKKPLDKHGNKYVKFVLTDGGLPVFSRDENTFLGPENMGETVCISVDPLDNHFLHIGRNEAGEFVCKVRMNDRHYWIDLTVMKETNLDEFGAEWRTLSQ
ncbi:hypothetical protein ACF0H5_007010 [Mactra antiquata]